MIIGLVNLDKTLDNMMDADLVKPMNRAISLVENAARANCPSDTGELKGSINHYVKQEVGKTVGVCMTNKSYAIYVEMGTGPKGQMNHYGISPNANPVYTQSPWWIHEGDGPNEVSRETGEKYHWHYIDTEAGRFYECSGQAAQPFMYPALKDNVDAVVNVFKQELSNGKH